MALFDVDYPELGVGTTTLGNATVNLTKDTGANWVSPDWVWDCKVAQVNQWIPLGTDISTKAVLFFDASVFPYREVCLTTQINF